MKKFEQYERRGLPGGPNEITSYMTGAISTQGYKSNSPDKYNDFNIIRSGNITMEGVDFPVFGMDNLGNMAAMMPGANYKFPGSMVFEMPMAQQGIEFLDPNRPISSQASGYTQSSEADRIAVQDAMNQANAERVDEREKLEYLKELDNEARALGFNNYAEYSQAKQQENLFGVTDNTYTTQADNLGMYDDIYLPEIDIIEERGAPTFLGSEFLGSLFPYGGAEALPVVGEGIDALEFADAVKKRNYLDALIYAGAFAVPFLGGAALKKLFSRGAKQTGRKTDFQKDYPTTTEEGFPEIKVNSKEEYLALSDAEKMDFQLQNIRRDIDDEGYDSDYLRRLSTQTIGDDIKIIDPTGNQQAILEDAFNNAISRELARNNSPENLQRLINQGMTEEQARRFIVTRNKAMLDHDLTYYPFSGGPLGFFNTDGMIAGLNKRTLNNNYFGRNRRNLERKSFTAHEMSHLSDLMGRLLTKEDYRLIDNALRDNIDLDPDDIEYFTKPTEVRARINELRDFFQDRPNLDLDIFELKPTFRGRLKQVPDFIKYQPAFDAYDELDMILKPGQIKKLMKELSEAESQQDVNEMPMAQKGIEVPKREGVRENSDGTVSTHIMRTEFLPDKGWVVFPSLFQNQDGSWVDMSQGSIKNWMPVYEEALKRNEVIYFGDDKEGAINFGEGSWKKERGGSLPMAQRGGGKTKYVGETDQGGYRVGVDVDRGDRQRSKSFSLEPSGDTSYSRSVTTPKGSRNKSIDIVDGEATKTITRTRNGETIERTKTLSDRKADRLSKKYARKVNRVFTDPFPEVPNPNEGKFNIEYEQGGEAAAPDFGSYGLSIEDTLLFPRYINYMNGNDESIEARRVYDKLNRKVYRYAKQGGMTAPDYMMTEVLRLGGSV